MPENPWPNWAFILRTSSSHEEGCIRDYSILTKHLSGENGQLKKLHAVRLQWSKDAATGQMKMSEIAGSEFEMDCDLLLLALGFLGPVKKGMLEELGVALDARGNVFDKDGAGLGTVTSPQLATEGIASLKEHQVANGSEVSDLAVPDHHRSCLAAVAEQRWTCGV